MRVPGTGYHPARILTSGTIRLRALSPLIIICHALSLREMKTRVENDIVFAKQDNPPISLREFHYLKSFYVMICLPGK